MSRARIALSDAAIQALVDAAPPADVRALSLVFGSLLANPACSGYARCVRAGAGLELPPERSGARERTLGSLAPPPADSAAQDSLAFTGLLVAGGALGLDELCHAISTDLAPYAPPPALVALGLGAALAADRYANRGAGAAMLARGGGRVGGADVAREARAEAAACTLGYVLGLPWCALEPRARRVCRADTLALAAADEDGTPGAAARGGGGGAPGPLGAWGLGGAARAAGSVDRCLVWLLAPAAAEWAAHGELKYASTAEAAALLAALRSSESEAAARALGEGGWAAEEDGARVAWAWAQARALLKQFDGATQRLADAMAAGGLTAGGAVCRIEAALR